MTLHTIVQKALQTGILTESQESYITSLICNCDWSSDEMAALEILTTALKSQTVELEAARSHAKSQRRIPVDVRPNTLYAAKLLC